MSRPCASCGAKARDGDSFCVKCGAAITGVAAAAGPAHVNEIKTGRLHSLTAPMREHPIATVLIVIIAGVVALGVINRSSSSLSETSANTSAAEAADDATATSEAPEVTAANEARLNQLLQEAAAKKAAKAAALRYDTPGTEPYRRIRQLKKAGVIEDFTAERPKSGWRAQYTINDGDALVRFRGKGYQRIYFSAYGKSLFNKLDTWFQDHGYDTVS